MKKLLHYIGFHFWKYSADKQSRVCKYCGKSQHLINEGSVNGMSDFTYWMDSI